jgi:ribose transport system permease protein
MDKNQESIFIKLIPFFEKYGILLLILIMVTVLHLLQPDVFLSWRNVTNIFKQVSWQSMLALGVFMVIVTAGIDLSVGSIVMLSLMGLAIASKAGLPWYVVMLVAPAVGFLCGLFNGLGITLLRMPHPFIMTLGTLYIFRGVGNLISGGVPITGFADQIRVIGNGKIKLESILGEGAREYIPTSLILMIVIFFLFWIFLNHTRIGKWIYAIGGNPGAARAAGINVDRILVIVYTLCGFLAGIGGLILAGRTNSAYPNAGLQSELDAIAAVIIGGASFFGGRGTVLGVFAGVMIMGILRNGLNLMNVSVFWQQVLIGSIIILAVYIDVLRRQLSTRN